MLRDTAAYSIRMFGYISAIGFGAILGAMTFDNVSIEQSAYVSLGDDSSESLCVGKSDHPTGIGLLAGKLHNCSPEDLPELPEVDLNGLDDLVEELLKDFPENNPVMIRRFFEEPVRV